MNWTARMNLALDYIEAHLDGVISVEEVASAAYCSKFHFHRVFYATFNVTCAEYIRKRKLTLAALDVASNNQTIMDVALKYGYESPNAFTRAFRSVHGINPSDARSGKVALSSYSPVSFPNIERGIVKMDYSIVSKPQFNVLGSSKKFSLDNFIKQGAKYWKDYVGSERYTKLLSLNKGMPGQETHSPLLSVYFPVEDDNKDEFIDVLGIESAEVNSADFNNFQVPDATYAEFNCTYKTSMKTNRYIYSEWFAATVYERDDSKPDVLAYFPIPFRPMSEMRLRWWIPVRRESA